MDNQEALLIWPVGYTALLGPLPMLPRPLEPVKENKRKDYLKVAEVLIERVPTTESTKRAVEFLMRTCDASFRPDAVPPLPWIHQGSPMRGVGLPRVVGRIAPAMKFHAQHLRAA